MPLPTSDSVNVDDEDVQVLQAVVAEGNGRPSTSSLSQSFNDDVFEESLHEEEKVIYRRYSL